MKGNSIFLSTFYLIFFLIGFLTYKDYGIGIPKKDQASLFESFSRASNVGDIDGTGLGLVIVKQFIEMHGGTISFQSEVHKGTTFTIAIPNV